MLRSSPFPTRVMAQPKTIFKSLQQFPQQFTTTTTTTMTTPQRLSSSHLPPSQTPNLFTLNQFKQHIPKHPHYPILQTISTRYFSSLAAATTVPPPSIRIPPVPKRVLTRPFRPFTTTTTPTTTTHSILYNHTTPLNTRHHLTHPLPFRQRRQFHSTTAPFIFQQGLGRAGQSRSRLGASGKSEPHKVRDPLGLEAKQQRLEAQLTAMKEGNEFDQFAGLTEEQRAKQQAYIAKMNSMENTLSWVEFVLTQPTTLMMVYYIIIGSTLSFGYWVYMKYIRNTDAIETQGSIPYFREFIEGKIIPHSMEYYQEKFKEMATPAQVKEVIKKFKNDDYVQDLNVKLYGTVPGAWSLEQMSPVPSPWDIRSPIIYAFLSSGISYPDYVGNGHFHIYYNGSDQIPKLLAKVQQDNNGMPFTYQILSPTEQRKMFMVTGFQPRTMEQLERGEPEPPFHDTVVANALNIVDISARQLEEKKAAAKKAALEAEAMKLAEAEAEKNAKD